MDTAGERFGHLDILINPAAILVDAGTRIDEYSEESWRRVIDVNLTGSFLLLKYAVPLMQQAGGGVVLLVISGAGVLGGSASLPYGSSKGGVRGLGPGGPRTTPPSEHPHPRRISGRDGDEHETGRNPRDGRKSGPLRRRSGAEIASRPVAAPRIRPSSSSISPPTREQPPATP